MQTETTKKLFTVDEYYKMAEAGILREDDRTELIEGEILQMSAMGFRHSACTARATHFFTPRLNGKAIVRVQLPLTLNELNEPEPDLSILEYRKDFYEYARTRPEDVLLVLEISDTSLRYDRDVKLPLYASVRIPEVWIADLNADALLVFREPSDNRYGIALIFRRGDSVSPRAFPEVVLPIEDLLGPGLL